MIIFKDEEIDWKGSYNLKLHNQEIINISIKVQLQSNTIL